jgi:hypothetical protein
MTPCPFAHEFAPLPRQLAQVANLRRRDEAATKQTALQQSRNPLATLHVGLAARHMLDVLSVDQQIFLKPTFQSFGVVLRGFDERTIPAVSITSNSSSPCPPQMPPQIGSPAGMAVGMTNDPRTYAWLIALRSRSQPE